MADLDPDALAEAIAEIFDDLPALGEYLTIRTKEGALRPFDWAAWHPGQRAFHVKRTGRDIVLKARQIGMSTLELARDLQYARTHEGVQVLVVVHDAEAKANLFATIKLMADGLEAMGWLPKPQYSTKTELTWKDNRSSVKIIEAGETETAAKKKGRSGTVNRLHATEVAFWGQAAVTLTAILDAVPQGGEVVIESTANGVGGVFHELWKQAQRGEGRLTPHFFPFFEHPEYRVPVRDVRTRRFPPDEQAWLTRLRLEFGLDDEQLQWFADKLDEKRAGDGLDAVLQENPPTPESAFRASGGQWLPAWACDAVDRHVRDPARTHRLHATTRGGGRGRYLGDLRIYEEPKRGRRYIAGADVAEGVGQDESTIVMVDHADGHVVATFASDSIEPGDFGHALADACRVFGNATAAPERNAKGDTVIRAMRTEARYLRVYRDEDGRHGWKTTTASRPRLFDGLRQRVVDAATEAREDGRPLARPAQMPDRQFAGQLRTLQRGKDGKVAARGKGTKGGAKDDGAVGWGIAIQVAARMPAKSGGATLPQSPFDSSGLNV